MIGVMPDTRGRSPGEDGQNPKAASEDALGRDRWSHLLGEPDALKGASPVRGETVGKGSGEFLIPRWRSTLVVEITEIEIERAGDIPPCLLRPASIQTLDL